MLDGLGEGHTRIVLTGQLGGGTVDGLRKWVLCPLRNGWAHGDHFLEDPGRPVLKFRHEGGRRVTMIRAASWFGTADGVDQVEQVDQAWRRLDELLADTFTGAKMLDSPAGTGGDCWLRTIPKGREWPTPPDDIQELIRAHAGQGRIEICPADFEIPRLVELDGRLMYGGLCWTLPGAFLSDDDGPYVPHARARYLVRAEVPAGWAHVGILPERHGGRWRYPSQPGEAFSSWCDGAELAVARAHGWPFHVERRLMFAEGKPLDRWATKLVGLALDEQATPLVRAGVRAMLLHALGGFVGRPRKVTRALPVAEADSVPDHATDVRVEGGTIAFAVETPSRQPMMRQPHWPAAVWGRARAALLHRPRLGVGALTLPRENVVGFWTDAIYLTADPGWPDDGKAGRFRSKLDQVGPFPAPMTTTELLALKERIAAGG